MRAKIILMTTLSVVSIATYALAAEGHGEHPGAMTEEKGSMGGHHEEGEQKSEAIAVGNKICPVTGEKVGSMGGDFKYEYKGKIYNLCCKMCLKDFKKNPEKYSKIADQRIAKEREEHKGGHSESGKTLEEEKGHQEKDSHSGH